MSGKISDNLGRSSGLIKGASAGLTNLAPYFKTYIETRVVTANATLTTVKFDDNYINVGGGTYDETNFHWTPGVAGVYQVTAQIHLAWASGVSDYLQVYLSKNGSTTRAEGGFLLGRDTAGAAKTSPNTLATGLIELDDDDNLRVIIYQTSGGAADIYEGDYEKNYFEAFLISGA